MAPVIPPDHHLGGQSFHIFDEGQHLSKDNHAVVENTGGQVLKELPDGRSSNFLPPANELERFAKSPDSKPGKIQANWRTARLKRPQVDAETFEPLGPVPEETSDLAELEDTGIVSPAAATDAVKAIPIKLNKEQSHVAAPSNLALQGQVERHIAGQFDWIMAYPVEATSSTVKSSQKEQYPECSSEKTFYGCNLLPTRRPLASQTQAGDLATNIYTVLATPLNKNSYARLNMNGPKGLDIACLPPPPYPGPPLKAPDVVIMVEQALSPSLTNVSERSGSLVDGSSRTGSFLNPRIEDSLEELDRLEDELDAVHQVANPCKPGPAKHESIHGTTCSTIKQSTATPTTSSNGASTASYSATVRVKSSDKVNPSLRRSASLRSHEKKNTPQQQESSDSKSIARGQSTTNRLSTPKHPVRSAKPPTIPKFELPGDAVARRLKEQREARLAQQAEAQKSQAPPPPKPRANKSLPKPTFELPGEAISRRKREEREAKLRAEDEEQRKRREFKARPVRHSIGPPHPPRGTLTSQARQSRASPEANGDKSSEGIQAKRMSMCFIRSNAPSTMGHSPGARGRMSMIMTNSDTSRATSTSMDSVSGKRSSVSLEDLAAQRQRGKEIFARENRFSQDKGNEKRERQMAPKMAREQAAERSRIASREWADRKRRKELAIKQASKDE